MPSYQRGFRWTKSDVERLLDDVYSEGGRGYCLQPIVVRSAEGRFELIDGQQRLTTIYLLYKYIHEASNKFLPAPKFTLTYETRKDSAQFLSNIDYGRRGENADYWHLCEAYEAIGFWHERAGHEPHVLTKLNEYLQENVKFIWYEAPASEDPIALFTRLNIGKIALTSSELVKAMFLSRSNKGLTEEGRDELSLQWDDIERRLHDEPLWYFLTNSSSVDYPTRIDLLLDIMAGKAADERDAYFTFFHFDELRKKQSLQDVWQDIQRTFLTFCEWFDDHDYYHKIGYLIASGTGLREVFELSKGMTKTEFRLKLDDRIAGSVKIAKDYCDLSYENDRDRNDLKRLLLLFNVESVRMIDEKSQRFPFDKHKKQNWTLEHIHAQQSEGLNREEQWREWIRLHIPSIEKVERHDLAVSMNNTLALKTIEGSQFEAIRSEVETALSAPGSIEHLHSISNLALLDSSDNSALSNSAFDVKRNAVIEMDKEGRYIPFCTKMVFLKYYTPSAESQLYLWGPADRRAYVEHINLMLKQYLDNPISVEMEG